MAVRYQATWKSMTGIQYRIDLLDDLVPGDTGDQMNIGTDGFTLHYEGKTDDITNHIISSSCSLEILIENSTIEGIISDIANYAEGRFLLRIMKYDSSAAAYKLWWAGVVIPDLSDWQDADYPYLYKLTALDGLSRLKEITYSPPSGYYSFIEQLYEVLGQLPTKSLWGTNDVFFTTAVFWFSQKMYSSAPAASLDPLKSSRVGYSAFTFLDDNKQRQYMNSFNVLKQIAEQWNLRIMFSAGRFWIIQQNYITNSTLNLHHYDNTGALISDEAGYSLLISSFNRKGSYKFLRPVSKVSFQNIYWMQSQSNRLPSQSSYAADLNVGLFSAANAETVDFSGDVAISVSDSGSNLQDNRMHFRMKLKIGSYYLKNDGSGYTWTTDPTARVDFYSPTQHDYNYSLTYSPALTTPELKEMGKGTFSFDFVQFEDLSGNALTPPSTVTHSISYSNFSLKQSLTDGKQPYFAETTLTGTLYEKKYDDLVTGDGPSSDDKGKIEVLNTSGVWEESQGDWTQNASGTPTWINQLLADKLLALQIKARRKYHGTIGQSHVEARHVLIINSKKYALMSGEYNANPDEWRGDWIEIAEN